MGIGATILMILFFPLNSFLLAQESLSGEKQVQADVIVGTQNVPGLVVGAETSRGNEQLKAQAVDNPEYQPVRLADVKDLAVPGAHASVIIDADTGTILQYSDGRTERQIASLTKLMTAVLVMEKIKNLDEPVTIDGDALAVEGTRVGCLTSVSCTSTRLQAGEKISVRNLLQAMLMNSTNDAANALGEHVAGSQDAFADLMNQKAKDLGLTDTHFCTPSGLEPDGHESECYSSAYDIARIAAYSMRYDTIWNMFRMPDNSEVTSADGKIVHTLRNTDVVLGQIPNIIGAKTGYTPLAGYSLLMAVSDPSTKHRIISVVLDDNTRWDDIKTMISWAFSSYVWK